VGRVALTLAVGILAVGVSGCLSTPFQVWDDVLGHDPAGPATPPRPDANSATEVLVQASGGQQGDGLFVEHDCIIGEPFQAGMISTAPDVQLRHGFAPPRLPDWPIGIARAETAPAHFAIHP
jgi:hypothetical protein